MDDNSTSNPKKSPRYNTIRDAFMDYISDTLGENDKNTMVEELTIQAGVNFDDLALSFLRLFQGLKMLYGEETAQIIAEAIIIKMNDIA